MVNVTAQGKGPVRPAQLRSGSIDRTMSIATSIGFLNANRVIDRRRFAEATKRSLHRVADEISSEMQTTNNLQSWSFESCRIDNAPGAIDFQFADVGVEFEDAVQKVQGALNENRPADFRDVKLDISATVRSWLRKNSAR